MITERNTKLFKNILATIVSNRVHKTYKNRGKEIHLNMDAKGNTKSIRIDGSSMNDAIAYYWIDNGTTKHTIGVITEGDYISFNRDLKVSKLLGEDVKILIKESVKFNDFTPVVGMQLKYNQCNVVVTKVTAKQFKFKFNNSILIGIKEFSARIDKGGKWTSNYYSFSLGNYSSDEIRKMREYDAYLSATR